MRGDERGAGGGLAILVIVLFLAVAAGAVYIGIVQLGFLQPTEPACTRTMEAHVTVQGPGTAANNTTVRVFWKGAEYVNGTTNVNGTVRLTVPCGLITVVPGGGLYLTGTPVVVDTEALGEYPVPVWLSVQLKPKQALPA